MTDKRSSLTPEAFEGLLAWLHPDREAAGYRYEDLRHRLIRIFAQRGCPEAEDLADETINRVAKKVTETSLTTTYKGDHALYFYGVAKKVHKEHVTRKPRVPVSATTAPDALDLKDRELRYRCLEGCLGELRSDHRELILEYYQDAKRKKIEHRKHLAEELGIAAGALRIRACRIRAILVECIRGCIDPQDGLGPMGIN